jgi:hypothetical protein
MNLWNNDVTVKLKEIWNYNKMQMLLKKIVKKKSNSTMHYKQIMCNLPKEH